MSEKGKRPLLLRELEQFSFFLLPYDDFFLIVRCEEYFKIFYVSGNVTDRVFLLPLSMDLSHFGERGAGAART